MAVVAFGALFFLNESTIKKVTLPPSVKDVTDPSLVDYRSKLIDFKYPAGFKVTGIKNYRGFFDIQFSKDGDYNKPYLGLTVNDLSDLPGDTRELPTSIDDYGFWEANSGGEQVYGKTFKRIKIESADAVLVTGKYRESKFDGEGNYKGKGSQIKFEDAEAIVNNKDVRFFAKAKTPNDRFFKQFEEIIASATIK
ncbi:MAG TPA: hypothetical protein VFW77_03410 [Candidatus Saccharimonadales bacterium]|nr:hypothetical protein [Candidatus Saccharimonadales bacterium]